MSIPITVHNSSGQDRVGWVTAVVPDDPDSFLTNLELAPKGWPVVAGEKTGARGRYMHIKADIGAYERVEGTLEPGAPPEQRMQEEEESALVHTNPVPTFTVDGNDMETLRFDAIEEGPARTVMHLVGRIPNTMLVVNAWFYVYLGDRVVPMEVLVTNSDFTKGETRQDFGELSVTMGEGWYPAIDFLIPRGGVAPALAGKSYRVVIARNTWLGHGQSLGFTGRAVLTAQAAPEDWPTLLAAVNSPLHAICPAWEGSWGPWGKMAELHPKADAFKAAYTLAARMQRAMQSTEPAGGERLVRERSVLLGHPQQALCDWRSARLWHRRWYRGAHS